MVSSHRCQNQIAVLDDHFRPTFEKATEPVRMIGDEREKPMHQDNHNAAANGCEKGELPLIARDRTDARITMSTASNAVLRASERLCPIRIMARVARKTMIPRSEIWRKVKSFGCEPSPSHGSMKL